MKSSTFLKYVNPDSIAWKIATEKTETIRIEKLNELSFLGKQEYDRIFRKIKENYDSIPIISKAFLRVSSFANWYIEGCIRNCKIRTCVVIWGGKIDVSLGWIYCNDDSFYIVRYVDDNVFSTS